jgi:hypothetical protein
MGKVPKFHQSSAHTATAGQSKSPNCVATENVATENVATENTELTEKSRWSRFADSSPSALGDFVFYSN